MSNPTENTAETPAPTGADGASHAGGGKDEPNLKRMAALVIGAIGVVYGDIGTSPLYALKECFHAQYGLVPNRENVFGILSLILWSIILVITCKYVFFVMRADNRGEGGSFALLALALRGASGRPRLSATAMILGLLGASLFYGEAMITPAISVLSAVEGIEIAAPALHPYIVPITLVILVGLFWIQSRGTHSVGRLFGPICILWFLALAVLGVRSITNHPDILMAISPTFALAFVATNGLASFLVLGAVVLAVTGGEALYADMGHFGRRPIQLAWLFLVMPALMLNYFGQGALLLSNPEAVENPFYLMVPSWGLYPMIVLATAATVIASQAVISGAFSLTRQAIQLGFCPRLDIVHTSDEEAGQIYIARVNWGLLIAVIALVIGFRSSSALAAAYGLSVTGTMVASAFLALVVARTVWGWRKRTVIIAGMVFFTIDFTFFVANIHKIPDGGWVPLVGGLGLYLLMTTWRLGRQVLARRLAEDSLSLRDFISQESWRKVPRVPGTAVFMTGNPEVVPLALLHNLKHNKVLHERVVFMTVTSTDVPRVNARKRTEVEQLGDNVYRIKITYGFVQEPNVPNALRLLKTAGLEFDLMKTSFFLGRETLIPSIRPAMPEWRERLFIVMSRNAMSATDFFKIPANRVIELGAQVQL